ncbi:MAG TPA: fused MFS/spermidine synthase, partial [Thermoanaerobaculia bacterium]|nr:fused MFS/spermidine synthase [Thermoanaerobaculia bacterium]
AGGYAFLVNGKSDGSALADAGTQVMGGLVGAMLHPRPERALVIGLGTGSTAGWLAEVPTMERVDAVELEPAILRVAEACAPVNHGVLTHPKVEVLLGDGREYLLTTDERYDVVFSEPSNPYRAGISSLYTLEFYRAARERLTQDGLFLQWLQGYEVDASVVRTAYATLAAVFPAVESWQTLTGDLLLVASEEPLAHDLARVRRRAAAEPYRSALGRAWGVDGADGFYAGFLAGPSFARAMAEAEGAEVNTDDRPVIEFGFVRNLGRSGLFSIEDLARLARERGEHRPAFRGPAPDGQRVDDARLARGAFFGAVPPAPPGDDALRERARLRRAFVDDDWRAVRPGWERQGEALGEPRHRVDLLAWAEALAEGGDPRARPAAERLREVAPPEADVVLALLESRQDNDQTAAWYLTQAWERLREDPWARPGLVRSSFRLGAALARKDAALAGALYDALAEPFAVAFLDQERRMTRLWMSASVGKEGLCVEAFADLEPWVTWDEGTLSARVTCYQEADHPLLSRA